MPNKQFSKISLLLVILKTILLLIIPKLIKKIDVIKQKRKIIKKLIFYKIYLLFINYFNLNTV